MRERTRDLRKDRVGSGVPPVTAFLDTARYVFRLARRLRAIRPDLVHTNTLKAGVYGSLAARLAGCRSCGTSAIESQRTISRARRCWFSAR